ncbi:hypothetical protein RHOSPDRAFT_27014 [Rhodotorula sp. JG-1b]|nr:hypothetical protein RHOSPDRAFT_27014 [Rhodotorula sp. JG-1b]
MAASMQLGPIRPVVSQTISQLALPKLPNERSDLWLTHPSYNGALVYAFESPAHYKPRNYERLETTHSSSLARVLSSGRLWSKTTLTQLATAFRMPDRILAAEEQATLVRNRANVQASILEPHLGAVHEEGDKLSCANSTSDSEEEPIAMNKPKKEPTPATNYIGALQEWKTEKGEHGRFVEYDKRQTGPNHRPQWIVTCTVDFPEYGNGLYREFEGSAETVAKAKNASHSRSCQLSAVTFDAPTPRATVHSPMRPRVTKGSEPEIMEVSSIYMDALQQWADENGVKLVMEYKKLKLDLGRRPEPIAMHDHLPA